MEKITKKQALNHIMGLVGEDEIALTYIKHELELLDKKKASVDTEKAKINDELTDKLLNVVMVAGTQYRPKELSEQCDALVEYDVSTQKITPILTKLVNDGLVIKVTDKKQSYYKLA